MKLRYVFLLCTLILSFLNVSGQTQREGDEEGTLPSDTAMSDQDSPVYGPVTSDIQGEGETGDSEPIQKILDTLLIEGLSVNYPQLVRNTINLKEKAVIRASDIAESVRKLYALGLFRSIDFLVHSETDSSAQLTLRVEEFPICEDVEYLGFKKLKQKDFDEKIIVKRGQVISDAAIFDIVNQLKKLYEEKGYNLVEVTPELVSTKIPGNALLKLQIKEGPKVRIKDIVFIGNNDVKTSRLERTFKTKENRWWRSGEFNRELFKEHLDTLVFFYNDLGYLDASIVKDSVYYGDDKKDLFIQITVDEGKKYLAGDFYFSGNKLISTDTLQSRITLREGRPFQKSRYEMSKYMVENLYREEGYLWVNVAEKRSFRNDTIDVEFEISEGHAAIVRKIEIKGNTKTMEKVIRREIDLFPGKKYRQSLMMRSRQNLMALNFFTDVKPDLVPNEDGTIDLVFAIVEKDNIGQLQLGMAYSGTGLVGTFATTIPNFRGTGQQLSVNISSSGKDHTDLSLGFIEPWAFDKPMGLSGNVYYNNKTFSNDENNTNIGFEIGVSRQQLKWPDDKFKVRVRYGLSWSKSTLANRYIDEFDLELLNKGLKNRFSIEIDRYDLDLPLFPTEGSRLTISPEYVGFGMEDQYLYFKATAKYEHYFQLPYKFVLGSRTKLGAISGLGNKIKCTSNDLFTLGGVYETDADLRGYKSRTVGGHTFNPERGLTMFASTLELRYPLLDQQLYLGAFTDVGNTWARVSDMDLGDLYKGIGVGVRVNVPMLGILGFDFAWGLDDLGSNWIDKKPHGFELHILMNKGF